MMLPRVRVGRPARFFTAALVLPLSACSGSDQPGLPEETGSAAIEAPGIAVQDSSPVVDVAPKKSILRPDVGPLPDTAPSLQPVTVTVRFPDQGKEPDETGLAAIDELIDNPTFKAGGAVTIWGHTDSRGSDDANLAASKKRAEAVRDHLERKGVDGGRLTVIPLGESRPIAPNRKLDGSDDPKGRARNRRVEIRVEPPVKDVEEGTGDPATMGPKLSPE
ncbi:OmpA-OmpF porin, OOP family [Novosphingobium mathurense]|uniref:OmpA-OmpF porin, OOP family n=1 Tax=Novosphingobium mathurense TaxID=428990 RepID=A0A1U6I3P8_9SPHN|nr:OmpA-OmpF porin, OOP family [Novosphingobium mathurense]